MGKEVEASKGNSTTNGINNTKFNNTNTHSILQVVKRYRHGKHVLIAELYRPCSKNAFNDLMYQQLIEAIEEVNGIPDLYALVITGNGSFFTAGADLKEGIEKNKKGIMTLPSKGYAHQFMKVFLNCNKLIIAAVNGPAIGIGVTLLLHSDFVFASDTATFWIPFMRLGLVPEFASSIVLPQIVGPLLANDLLLRSKQLNAQEALQARMINEIIPSSTKKNSFLPQVLRQVDEILASKVTQKSLPIFKSLLRRWRDPAIHEAIRIEFLHLDRQFLNGDLQEAIQQVVQSIGTKKKSNPQSKL